MGGRCISSLCAIAALSATVLQRPEGLSPSDGVAHDGGGTSVICRGGERSPCEPSWETFLYRNDSRAHSFTYMPVEALQGVEQLLRRRFGRGAAAKRGGSAVAAVALHVGPNDLRGEAPLYAKLLAFTEGRGRFVFVEPSAMAIAGLRENLGRVGVPANNFEVIPAAVCPTDDGAATLHTIATERFVRDFPEAQAREEMDLGLWFSFYSSLDRQYLVDDFYMWGQGRYSPEQLEPYIEANPVRCYSPRGLLSHLGLPAESIDSFTMDAEGCDAELLHAFLDMEGFAPAVVQFEWIGHNNRSEKVEGLIAVVRRLHARGYEVHRHQHDVVAASLATAPDLPSPPRGARAQ